MTRALLLLIGLSLAGCQSPEPRSANSTSVERLAEWMGGSFSSGAQAAADPENYLDVRLEMRRIWPERIDGAWLYVEQAVASALDRPYRQRIYRVHDVAPGELRSEVFELPGDPLIYAGAFEDVRRLDALRPRELALRVGCEVHLRRTGTDEFRGSTLGDGCASTLRGAAFATSHVVVTSSRIESWDRGFDHEGAQVWGATHGPYVFLER